MSLRSGRAALLDAAERLIAEQGPAVSLRQVVAAAGQRNSAAVRYHFGTREDLIAAVIEERQAVFESERLQLLAALEARGDVTRRDLVEALLEPVFRHQRATRPGHHARFMEKIRDLPGVALVGRSDWAATALIVNRLTADAPAAPPAARTRAAVSVAFALLADLERQDFPSEQERSAAERAAVDMLVGALGAASDTPAVSR